MESSDASRVARGSTRVWCPILTLVFACGHEPIPPRPADCLRAREAVTARLQDPAFDTDSALAELRARGDTLRQHFGVVYREGPTAADSARFAGWGAPFSQPYGGEPWLEVLMTLRQAEVVAASPRVARVVPGVIFVGCPGDLTAAAGAPLSIGGWRAP
jgi:hypothetical protein